MHFNFMFKVLGCIFCGVNLRSIPVVRKTSPPLKSLPRPAWGQGDVLTHIKDQTLLVIYPNMREVLTQLGMLISVPLVSAKPSKKKNIKKAPKAPTAPKAPKAPKLPWFKTILK